MPSPPPTTAKARAPRSSRHPRSRWGTKSPAGWIGYGSSDFGAHRSKIPLLARAPSPQPRALSPNLCLHRPSYSNPCCPFVHTRSERSIGLPCRGRRKLLHGRVRARRWSSTAAGSNGWPERCPGGAGPQRRLTGDAHLRCALSNSNHGLAFLWMHVYCVIRMYVSVVYAPLK